MVSACKTSNLERTCSGKAAQGPTILLEIKEIGDGCHSMGKIKILLSNNVASEGSLEKCTLD